MKNRNAESAPDMETEQGVETVQEAEADPGLEPVQDTQDETRDGSPAQTAGDALDVRVYCGPSVPLLVRQYTVFSGGVPSELTAFCEAHPAARGLLVPLEQFAETRMAVETKGTAEYTLCRVLEKELAADVRR